MWPKHLLHFTMTRLVTILTSLLMLFYRMLKVSILPKICLVMLPMVIAITQTKLTNAFLIFCFLLQQWNPTKSKKSLDWRGYAIATGTFSHRVRRPATVCTKVLRGSRLTTSYENNQTVEAVPDIRSNSKCENHDEFNSQIANPVWVQLKRRCPLVSFHRYQQCCCSRNSERRAIESTKHVCDVANPISMYS